jgi:hypothetical protein
VETENDNDDDDGGAALAALNFIRVDNILELIVGGNRARRVDADTTAP